MDKYKVIVRIEETKKLASEKKYKEAYEEMKFLNLAKMKNYEDLIIFADIFVRNKKYVEAKELLERLHKKTVTRRLLTQLIFVSAKTKNFVDAEKYYEEYIKIAPKDINRYILRYRIDKEKGVSKDMLIRTLEELKEYDYIEEWAYELAKLYHKAGRSKECIRECSNIELWFGDGIVVEKAKLLREHHISALSDEPLGKISNEIMDFTATGKLIDLLGMIPANKGEEDTFAHTSEFEKDNDKVDEKNKKFLPEYKEEYHFEEASSGEMKEISFSDNKIIGDEGIKEDNDDEEREELAKILAWEDKKDKPRKHNSFMKTFRDMLFIKDYEGEDNDEYEEEVEEDLEASALEENTDIFKDEDTEKKDIQKKDVQKEELQRVDSYKEDLVEEGLKAKVDYEETPYEELEDSEDPEDSEISEESKASDEEIEDDEIDDDEEIEDGEIADEEEVKVELSDADFDPELLALEKIIVEEKTRQEIEKSKREIETEANNVARDIRKDLAQEISSYVEEEKKVKNEFKEDMEKLDAMVTKRIIGVDDILKEQSDTNPKSDTKVVEPVIEKEKKADQPRLQVDEPTQRENVEEVLAKTSIPEVTCQPSKLSKEAAKNSKISEELFRNFAKNESLSDSLAKAFARVSENKRCAHFIISGESKTGKSTLAKMIAKQLKNMGALATGKVARIDATKFNNVDLELKQDSLVDCCIIINNAHEISPYAITGLISMLIKFNGRTMVILETNNDANVILKKTSEVGAYFTNIIEMPKYTVEDLIELAISYADAHEYRINDSAEFAMRNILEERIETLSQTKLVESVINIIDNAVINAQSRNRNKIKEMITLKTTDFDGFNEIDMQDIMPL